MLSVGLHSQFSTPSSWKSKEAHSLALSFQVQTDSHVCRPCRDDLDRILRNPVHVPRLRKETKRECCIDNCRDISFVSSHIVNSKYEEALTIANLKCSIPVIPNPTPLCKQNYHMVYNIFLSAQTYCTIMAILYTHSIGNQL